MIKTRKLRACDGCYYVGPTVGKVFFFFRMKEKEEEVGVVVLTRDISGCCSTDGQEVAV